MPSWRRGVPPNVANRLGPLGLHLLQHWLRSIVGYVIALWPTPEEDQRPTAGRRRNRVSTSLGTSLHGIVERSPSEPADQSAGADGIGIRSEESRC